MSFYFFIPLFLIFVFVVPICVKGKVSFDVLHNRGGVGFFVFGIKIKSFLFCFNGKNLMLYEDKGKDEIDFGGEEKKFLKVFLQQIGRKVKLKNLNVFYNFGVNDAFLTALFCGWINVLFDAIFLKLKDLKPTASFCSIGNAAFNEMKMDLSSNLKISISLLDVVYSFVNSVILTLKDKKTI